MERAKMMGVVIVLCGAIALVVSCGGDGGGGGGGTAQDAINTSATAFGEILDDILDHPENCTVKAMLECSCPGGGTVDWNTDTNVLTFNACRDSGGLTYTGTIQSDATVSSITADMDQFGQCTNVTGTVDGVDAGNCSGSLSGTCAGQAITCTMSADCETCTI